MKSYIATLLVLALAISNLGCEEEADCDPLPQCGAAEGHVDLARPLLLVVVHRTVVTTERDDGCSVQICEQTGFEFQRIDEIPVAGTPDELRRIAEERIDETDWSVVIDGSDVSVAFDSTRSFPTLVCVRDLVSRPACVQIPEPPLDGLIIFYEQGAADPLTVGGDRTTDFVKVLLN